MNVQRIAPLHRLLGATTATASLLVAYAALGQAASVAPAGPITSASKATTADIRDIRGPQPITTPWLIPLIAGTALLSMGGAYAAWSWNRRRSRNANKLPSDIALERLDQARRLMTPPRGREFSIEVSSVVRDYIESRFDLLATHLTTDEFLHQLVEPVDSFLAQYRALLDNFLQTCDLAKFGGWTLAVVDMEAMLTSARLFVEASADDTQVSHRRTAVVTVAPFTSSTSGEPYVSLPAA